MRRYLWLIAVLLLAGCGGEQAAQTLTVEPTPERALLRVENGSATDIDELAVRFPDERISFGSIAAGETTEYQPTQKGVYRYAALEITIAGQKQMYPVTDWVGERPELQGSYTLFLGADLNRPQQWITPTP